MTAEQFLQAYAPVRNLIDRYNAAGGDTADFNAAERAAIPQAQQLIAQYEPLMQSNPNLQNAYNLRVAEAQRLSSNWNSTVLPALQTLGTVGAMTVGGNLAAGALGGGAGAGTTAGGTGTTAGGAGAGTGTGAVAGPGAGGGITLGQAGQAAASAGALGGSGGGSATTTTPTTTNQPLPSGGMTNTGTTPGGTNPYTGVPDTSVSPAQPAPSTNTGLGSSLSTLGNVIGGTQTGGNQANNQVGGQSLWNWLTSPQGSLAGLGLLNSAFNNPSLPQQPDLMGLANQQYQNQLGLLNAQTVANRPTQVTPQGTVSWTQDANGNWVQTTSLSPEQQALYNQQVGQQYNLGGMIGTQGQNVANSLQNQYSLNPGQLQSEAANAAYSQATRYLDPQFQREQASLESQLANQGISRGTEAYTNAMNQFNEQRGQAYDQARNQAYTQGLMGANQAFNQSMAANQAPILNYNLLRGGQTQVSNPNMPSFNTQGMISGPDLLGAGSQTYGNQLGVYNAQAAQNNNLTGGLFSLANTFGQTR